MMTFRCRLSGGLKQLGVVQVYADYDEHDKVAATASVWGSHAEFLANHTLQWDGFVGIKVHITGNCVVGRVTDPGTARTYLPMPTYECAGSSLPSFAPNPCMPQVRGQTSRGFPKKSYTVPSFPPYNSDTDRLGSKSQDQLLPTVQQ